MREFAGALLGELGALECRAGDSRLADERNRRRGRRRETADRMHRLADCAGGNLVMGNLVLIAGRDRRASRCEAEMLGHIGAERPGEGHARRMMENRDKRLQQKRKNGEPGGPPMYAIFALIRHGRE